MAKSSPSFVQCLSEMFEIYPSRAATVIFAHSMPLKKEKFKELYPFESQWMQIDEVGNRVHYIEMGDGETILFLHGFPDWSFIYRDLIIELSGDFHCIAFDHLGYGFSDKPSKYRYNIENHVKNAIKFAENMHFKKFHLVMHDFGVAIGLALAERWPERISSMSFLNSSCFKHPKLPFSIMLMKLPIVSTIFTRLTNLLQTIFMHLGMDVLSKEIKKGYLNPYDSVSNRIGISHGLADIPLFPDHESIDIFEKIEEKTFILSSKKMKFFWADLDFIHNIISLRRWAKILPSAYLKRYEQAGHYSLEDSTEVRHDIRAFLLKCRNVSRFLFK